MSALLVSVDFWKFVVPLIGAVLAWFVNEWQKRLADQYQRKEANYKELIRSLRGFYVGATNADELKMEFVNQLNISWLYCPDEVIKNGYAFLASVLARDASQGTKELALGAFVESIRRDLLARGLVRHTSLTADDFKHFGVNPPQ